MAVKRPAPEVLVRVTYVSDPGNARAAQAILREGLRRGLVKLLHARAQKGERCE
ncbi:MAG: hypothetical protein JWN15_4158 [Firmicutes bacterium]|nr:hypothetical protein [Bacillota bacterium]